MTASAWFCFTGAPACWPEALLKSFSMPSYWRYSPRIHACVRDGLTINISKLATRRVSEGIGLVPDSMIEAP